MAFINIQLPSMTRQIYEIDFRPDERDLYQGLLDEAQDHLKKIKAVKVYPNISTFLKFSCGLDKCCHKELIGERHASEVLARLGNAQVVALTPENNKTLRAILQISIENQGECPTYSQGPVDSDSNPVITICKHVFHADCIERKIRLQHQCLLCHNQLANNQCLVYPKLEGNVDGELLDIQTTSSKIEALLKVLKQTFKDPLSKAVVFSQWRSYLDVIQRHIIKAGYGFTRIDGQMGVPIRDENIKKFQEDPKTKIFLVTFGVCSVGINLFVADTVILVDIWWTPGIEDQAVDRIYRIRQKRPCTFYRLVMKNSVEHAVLAVQDRKRKLVGTAFEEEVREGETKLGSLSDIREVLGVAQNGL